MLAGVNRSEIQQKPPLTLLGVKKVVGLVPKFEGLVETGDVREVAEH